MTIELEELTDEDVISYEDEDDDALFDDITAIKESLQKLMTRVVNLATKLEEHMNEKDAHNPAIMYKDK